MVEEVVDQGVEFQFDNCYDGFDHAGFVAYKEWQHGSIGYRLGTKRPPELSLLGDRVNDASTWFSACTSIPSPTRRW